MGAGELLLDLVFEIFLPVAFVWPGIGIRWAWNKGRISVFDLDDKGALNVVLSILFWLAVLGIFILLSL